MLRLKLSHVELPSSVEAVQRVLGFENSQRLLRVIQAYSRWGLQPIAYISFPDCTKNLLPHQPIAKEPGSRDEPHRFGINLESTSVKWKPNSLSFLYRSVSSTQKPTVSPAREREQTALSHSLHPIKPLDGLDSCCLLITGQTSQHEVCCINRSWNNSAIVLGKLGHFGVEHFHVNYPHWLSGLGAALVEWREQSNETCTQLIGSEALSGCISASGCWRYDGRGQCLTPPLLHENTPYLPFCRV